jgi:hypothetical protein
MAFDVALAHKLAAWNERRLLRDLYDALFLYRDVGVEPDPRTLDDRLARIRSRLPRLRSVRRMSRADFGAALEEELRSLEPTRVDRELRPLLPPEETAGLHRRLRAQLTPLVAWLTD